MTLHSRYYFRLLRSLLDTFCLLLSINCRKEWELCFLWVSRKDLSVRMCKHSGAQIRTRLARYSRQLCAQYSLQGEIPLFQISEKSSFFQEITLKFRPRISEQFASTTTWRIVFLFTENWRQNICGFSPVIGQFLQTYATLFPHQRLWVVISVGVSVFRRSCKNCRIDWVNSKKKRQGATLFCMK